MKKENKIKPVVRQKQAENPPIKAINKRYVALVLVALLLIPLVWQVFSNFVIPLKQGWHLAWGYQWKELNVASQGKTGFTLLPKEQTGINFVNSLDDKKAVVNRILYNGSGVAAGDIDNDGLCDLYFSHIDGSNTLYKNLGNWKFQDITEQAGVACTNKISSGTTFADVDGDGALDLLVAGVGTGLTLFHNNGNGTFTDITQQAGLSSTAGSMSIALADIDGDGDLDIYLTNYRKDTIKDKSSGQVQFDMVDGKLTIPKELEDRLSVVNGTLTELGEPDILYINNGNNTFQTASWTDGRFLDENGNKLKKPPLDWGLSVIFRDIDGDGDPDIYVCNDFASPDRMWINDGKGNFRAVDKLVLREISATSMGVDFADINRDGHYDFFVVDMLSPSYKLRQQQMPALKITPTAIGEIDNRPQVPHNTLFLNRGDNTYSDISFISGLSASDWSWTSLFLDIDLDGYEDLFITNGHGRDVQNADTIEKIRSMDTKNLSYEKQLESFLLYPRLETPNLAFKNLGNLQFKDVSKEWGLDLVGISHGVALADLDNDGDLDMVVNNLQSGASVYRNDTNAPRVAVKLKGSGSNPNGIGAKITLRGGDVVEQSQEIICGGRYLSGGDTELVFAPGKSQTLSLEVTWRNGQKSVVNNVKPNNLYQINESSSSSPNIEKKPLEVPMFVDVSDKIKHTHYENEFDDFQRQPLLPNRLSRLGPGLAWYDINGDGNEDLIITTGKGGKPVLFLSDGNGNFTPGNYPAFNPTERDLSSILAWKDPNSTSLLFGSSSYEDSDLAKASALGYSFQNNLVTAGNNIAGRSDSTGPMAIADVDGDGRLDLFIGGRVIPGQYPRAASSQLFRNNNGQFSLDTANSAKLANIGLVSGAVFSDIDGDGDQDLILAIEWGSIKVFLNDKGNFTDVTEKLGLNKYQGWWHGVTTGDLDNDGKLDIIATNWGTNSKYKTSTEHPIKLYPIENNGTLDLIEAYFDEGVNNYVPVRKSNILMERFPDLRKRFPSYKEFSEAGLKDLFPNLDESKAVSANTLEHMVFFNRGDHFEAVPLPVEAQFSPAFGVNVADLDGDGNEDIFIAQNFFATALDSPRCDGGRSLFIKGDGKGGLVAIPGQKSGIQVYGEGRGTALADYDKDGRIDLVVSQNGAATKLYHNLGAKPGLRIRLQGQTTNPNGVGASIRLVYPSHQGPIREIHIGSGYWSQDSIVAVMGIAENPTSVLVRWPDGKTSTTPISDISKELIITQP